MTRILVAPDKFKGTLTAGAAAAAISLGWRRVRPFDVVVELPMADGGDGTAAIIASADGAATWSTVRAVDAIGNPRQVHYPVLSDGTAVVELASICGLADLDAPAPVSSHTYGLGMVLSHAARECQRIMVALGGSASTDGGFGALRALGAIFLDANSDQVLQADDARDVHGVDLSELVSAPAAGVELLVDCTATLTGTDGAATVFGPQKGATDADIALLEKRLSRLAAALGGAPAFPGSGAAGGAAFGLAAGWGARIVSGSAAVADLLGLAKASEAADLVITGEGRYDETSAAGKVCGEVQRIARDRRVRCEVIAGSVAADLVGCDLSVLAGGAEKSLMNPEYWLASGAAMLAREFTAAERS